MKAFENNLLRPTFEKHQSFRGIQIDYSIRINPFRRYFYKADFEEKAVPQFVNLMVKLLNANGGKYLVGNEVRKSHSISIRIDTSL